MIKRCPPGPPLASEVSGTTVRPVRAGDYAGWRPLWDGWQTQETNQAARALYMKLAQHNGFIVYTHEL